MGQLLQWDLTFQKSIPPAPPPFNLVYVLQATKNTFILYFESSKTGDE
jgi:hypothetical protein